MTSAGSRGAPAGPAGWDSAPTGRSEAGSLPGVSVSEAAVLSAEEVLGRLISTPGGLDPGEAARRLRLVGPNAVRSHHAQPLRILGRQLRSVVLILLAVTAFISFLLGQRTDTVVIGVILLASVGLGFLNEYRAERATEALHSQVLHRAVTLRGGRLVEVEVTGLVPGDVVRLVLGELVPADLSPLSTTGLECDESVLTGKSLRADFLVAEQPPVVDLPLIP